MGEEKNKTNLVISIALIFIAIIGCIFAFFYIDKIKGLNPFYKEDENELISIFRNNGQNDESEKKLITAYNYLDITKNEVTSHLEEYNSGKYSKYVYYDSSSKKLLLLDQKTENEKPIYSLKCSSIDCSIITPSDINEGKHVFNILVFLDGDSYLIANINLEKLYKINNLTVNEYNTVNYVNREIYYNIETKGIIFSTYNRFKYYSYGLNDIVNEIDATYDETDSRNYGKYFVAKYLNGNSCISSLIDVSTGEETKKINGYYSSPKSSEEKNRFGINTKLFYDDCNKKRINILDDENNPVFDEFYDNLNYDISLNKYSVYNNGNSITKTYDIKTKKITTK